VKAKDIKNMIGGELFFRLRDRIGSIFFLNAARQRISE